MSCMKCGRKTEENRAFCADCMEEMEKYPVRPGTVVRLPHRTNTPVSKKRRHTFRRPSDQLELMRVRIRLLTIAFLITLLCFFIMVALVIWLVEWHNFFPF